MNTIIALRGKGESGKSTTIGLLYDILLQNGYLLKKSNSMALSGDFSAVFSKNEKLIGLTSLGDNYKLVHDKLQYLVDANCNICVCACRTFDRNLHGTNVAIKEFSNFSNQFVEKTLDENATTQHATNIGDARSLFSLIDNMV